jgi:hypothetical protein
MTLEGANDEVFVTARSSRFAAFHQITDRGQQRIEALDQRASPCGSGQRNTGSLRVSAVMSMTSSCQPRRRGRR